MTKRGGWLQGVVLGELEKQAHLESKVFKLQEISHQLNQENLALQQQLHQLQKTSPYLRASAPTLAVARQSPDSAHAAGLSFADYYMTPESAPALIHTSVSPRSARQSPVLTSTGSPKSPSPVRALSHQASVSPHAISLGRSAEQELRHAEADFTKALRELPDQSVLRGDGQKLPGQSGEFSCLDDQEVSDRPVTKQPAEEQMDGLAQECDQLKKTVAELSDTLKRAEVEANELDKDLAERSSEHATECEKLYEFIDGLEQQLAAQQMSAFQSGASEVTAHELAVNRQSTDHAAEAQNRELESLKVNEERAQEAERTVKAELEALKAELELVREGSAAEEGGSKVEEEHAEELTKLRLVVGDLQDQLLGEKVHTVSLYTMLHCWVLLLTLHCTPLHRS